MTKRIVVTRAEAGRTVAALLKAHLRLSTTAVRDLVTGRRVRLGGHLCPNPGRRVTAGQSLEVDVADRAASPARRPKKRSTPPPPHAARLQPTLRYADAQLVVVDKPAGLTTMRHVHEAAEFGARGRRFLPPTLADLLPALLAQEKGAPPGRVHAVHRLDKETSGVVVFARTAEAERHLGRQFRAHTIERRYLALVRGRPTPGRIESYLIDDRGDGRRGSTDQPGEGQRAVTHVEVLEEFGDFALVECCLETGRTHQVRIHLGERGTPLCGERIYDRPRHGQPLPDGSGASRPCLHAASLGLAHPATGKRMTWSAPLPKDMAELLKRLRRRS